MMIGSLVASGTVRVRRARDEMARMERTEPGLRDTKYRERAQQGGHGVGKAICASKYEDLQLEIRKATAELENARALHGRPRGEGSRMEGDWGKFGNRIAAKRERDRA